MKVIKLNYVLGVTTGVILGYSSLAQQDLQWAQKISGPSFDASHIIVADRSGNIYAGGSFANTLSFGAGSSVAPVQSGGKGDLFISCYDAQGKLLWCNTSGGVGMDAVKALTTDMDDHLIAAGSIEGLVDLDPGPGTVTGGAEGLHSVFVSKFDGKGDLLWTRTIGSPDFITCNSVKTDEEGNIYYTGSFKSEVDFDPGNGSSLRSPSGRMRDMYISKLDKNGNYLWSATFAAVCNDLGHAFVTDRSGLYVSGSFYSMDPVDFDPGASQQLVQPATPEDLFLLKLSNNGQLLWVNHLKGSFYNGKSSLAAHETDGIYLAGNFHQTVDADPSASSYVLSAQGSDPDAFVARFDHNGSFKWAQQIGGAQAEEANAISIGKNAEIVFTGLYTGSMDANPGSGTFDLNSAGNYDVFILRLNSSGQFLCAGSIGGSQQDQGSNLVFDDFDNLFFSGIFSGTADLNPGPGSFNVTPAGSNEVYLCKISSCSIMTGMNEGIKEDHLKIFPNPSSGEFTIGIQSDEYSEVRIINLLGAEVLKMSVKTGNNHLSLSGLPKGIYFACFYTRNNQEPLTKKLLVQ